MPNNPPPIPPRDALDVDLRVDRVPFGWRVIASVQALDAAKMDAEKGDSYPCILALWALCRSLEEEGVDVQAMFAASPWRKGETL